MSLQRDFDDYIASSREMENRLNAVILSLKNKLWRASKTNKALSSQLEILMPQVTNMESSLSKSRERAKIENALRCAAEQARHKAEDHARDAEERNAQLSEENDRLRREIDLRKHFTVKTNEERRLLDTPNNRKKNILGSTFGSLFDNKPFNEEKEQSEADHLQKGTRNTQKKAPTKGIRDIAALEAEISDLQEWFLLANEELLLCAGEIEEMDKEASISRLVDEENASKINVLVTSLNEATMENSNLKYKMGRLQADLDKKENEPHQSINHASKWDFNLEEERKQCQVENGSVKDLKQEVTPTHRRKDKESNENLNSVIHPFSYFSSKTKASKQDKADPHLALDVKKVNRITTITSNGYLLSSALYPPIEALQESRTDVAVLSPDDETRTPPTRNIVAQSLTDNPLFQSGHIAQSSNGILSLQINMQVCCRVCPVMPTEITKSTVGKLISVEALNDTEVRCFSSRFNDWENFLFDKVWGPDKQQEDIFQDVDPLAESVVDGFHACIFSYGQT